MRIIGGSLRGKKLFSISGLSTRPTSDRIRESIFNILSIRVMQSRVLDLYAGTGALGLEALSRGADFGLFVDRDVTVIATVRKNIQACRLESRADSIQWDIQRNLRCLEGIRPPFDLVFMDPPYDQRLCAPTIHYLAESGTTRFGTTLVVEHSIREELPDVIGPFRAQDRRKYGKTLVSFFDYLV